MPARVPIPPHRGGDLTRPFQFSERWLLAHVVDTSRCVFICGSQRNGRGHVLDVARGKRQAASVSGKMISRPLSVMLFTTEYNRSSGTPGPYGTASRSTVPCRCG